MSTAAQTNANVSSTKIRKHFLRLRHHKGNYVGADVNLPEFLNT